MGNLKSLVLAAVLAMGASPLSAQDFERGQAAFAAGDYQTAMNEWLPLAQQGDAEAQGILGLMYHKGFGVQENDVEAVRWFQLAAKQGHTEAQFMLGGKYFMGQGAPTDRVKGYMWLDIASVNYEQAAISRNQVATKLTPEEITKAQGMARECVNSGYENCGDAPTTYEDEMEVLRDAYINGTKDLEVGNITMLRALSYNDLYERATRSDDVGRWLSDALEGRGDDRWVSDILTDKADEAAKLGGGSRRAEDGVWVPEKYRELLIHESKDRAISRQIWYGLTFGSGNEISAFVETSLRGGDFDQVLAEKRAYMDKFSQTDPMLARIMKLIGMLLSAIAIILAISAMIVRFMHAKGIRSL